MKRFKYRQKQKRKENLSLGTVRLILERTLPIMSGGWDYCRILYQDPAFYSKTLTDESFYHISIHNGISYTVKSELFPQFNCYGFQSDPVTHLLGSHPNDRFTMSGSITRYISRFWTALDLWTREYKWPKTKSKISLSEYIPFAELPTSHYINNLITQNPSEHMLRRAEYMIFCSP